MPSAMSSSGPTIARSIADAATCCCSLPTSCGEIDDAREERDAGVSGHDVDRRDAVAAREAPRDRVFAPTAAEHETVEARSAEGTSGAALPPLLLDDLLYLLAVAEVVADLLHVTPTPARSLPFDRRRGLRRDVVDDAVHGCDLVHDPRRRACEHVVWQARPIGGHEVFGRHRAERDQRAVGAEVPHDTDTSHRSENGEGLGDGAVEVGGAQFLEEDRIRLPQRVERLAVDRTEHTD